MSSKNYAVKVSFMKFFGRCHVHPFAVGEFWAVHDPECADTIKYRR